MDANGNMTVAGTVSSGTPMGGLKNRIINGNFDVWQRGTSLNSVNNVNEYSADRWRSEGYTANTTITRQSFTGGQTAVPDNPTYYATVALNNTNTGGYWGFMQRIESPQVMRAYGTYTLSFWVRATSGTVAAGGWAYGINSPISGPALTTTWQKVTHTVTLSNAGAETAGYVSVYLVYLSQNTTALSIDVAHVQVEAGLISTGFESRPYGMELALCEYYYKKLIVLPGGGSGYGALSYYGGTSAVIYHGHFTMRTSPNTSYLNNAAVQYYSYAGVWTASTASINRIGSGPYFVSSWFTADGDGRGKLMRKNDANDLILVLDAEL